MERVEKNLAYIGIWAFFLALAAVPATAHGGTVFAPPEPAPPAPKPGEVYSESRFGAPPARPDLGVDSAYAARATNELERGPASVSAIEGDEESYGVTSASRAPAGLEFQGAPRVKPDAPERLSGRLRMQQEPDTVKESAAIMRKGVQEVALIAGDLGFFPKTVFVSRDVPVRMFVTGSSKNTLCIMMDSFQVRRQIRSQKIEEVTFTPNVPGRYRFYCPVNGMEGVLVVKELTSTVDPGIASADLVAPVRAPAAVQ